MSKAFSRVIFLILVLSISVSFAGVAHAADTSVDANTTDTIVGPTSNDPYKDILEVGRAYGALYGIDGCSFAKSMSGVFHVETSGKQNLTGGTGTFIGSFQMGVPYVKEAIQKLGPDLTAMSKLVDEGKIDRSVYQHMLGSARQGQVLGPNRGRLHHMYSTMLSMAQHVRMEKALQGMTGNQAERAGAHVSFQFAPAKVKSAINTGNLGSHPKWFNNCNLGTSSVGQAVNMLASGQSKCSGRMKNGISKINCQMTSGYTGPSGFGNVPDYVPQPPANPDNWSQYGNSDGMRDYASPDDDYTSPYDDYALEKKEAEYGNYPEQPNPNLPGITNSQLGQPAEREDTGYDVDPYKDGDEFGYGKDEENYYDNDEEANYNNGETANNNEQSKDSKADKPEDYFTGITKPAKRIFDYISRKPSRREASHESDKPDIIAARTLPFGIDTSEYALSEDNDGVTHNEQYYDDLRAGDMGAPWRRDALNRGTRIRNPDGTYRYASDPNNVFTTKHPTVWQSEGETKSWWARLVAVIKSWF